MPAGLTRRPQKSELIRALSCQSGPDSSSTTFLPALANTEAYRVPEAPAPTMTTSVFSFAMSPPLQRRNVRHVGNAERGIAFHRAVDDVNGIAAENEVTKGPAGPCQPSILFWRIKSTKADRSSSLSWAMPRSLLWALLALSTAPSAAR